MWTIKNEAIQTDNEVREKKKKSHQRLWRNPREYARISSALGEGVAQFTEQSCQSSDKQVLQFLAWLRSQMPFPAHRTRAAVAHRVELLWTNHSKLLRNSTLPQFFSAVSLTLPLLTPRMARHQSKWTVPQTIPILMTTDSLLTLVLDNSKPPGSFKRPKMKSKLN